MKKIASAVVAIEDVKNPVELDENHLMRKYLAESFGNDFLAYSWQDGDSAENITNYILGAHPGFTGVAYLDSFGNLIQKYQQKQ